MTIDITCAPYGTTKKGEAIEQYHLANNHGVQVDVINYGGIITHLQVPDRKGHLDDVVLGYDSLAEYESCAAHFGCLTGRYANRIKKGRFDIDSRSYQLETNHGQNHLHGASAGFGKVVWQAEVVEEPQTAALKLCYVSPDGHGGYPGNLQVEVVYRLNDLNQFSIEYRATTDKPTIVNLTNHSYFNLAGHQHATVNGVLDHHLSINGSSFVPTDDAGIPLGGLEPVDGTALDFRNATRIGTRIDAGEPQLVNGKGYDHNWVITGPQGEMKRVASVNELSSGRVMNVETTQPGVQFYSGNNLAGQMGKSGVRYDRRGALCLETQYFPDAPNNPDFPTTIVRPGQQWSETARFTFRTVN